jgi:hypothetical protein
VNISGGGAAAGPPPGWPITAYCPPFAGSGSLTAAMCSTPNTLNLTGFVLPVQVQLNKVTLNIATADAGHLYSVAIYNSLGALVCSSTPAAIAATGIQNFTMASGPFTLAPGRYYIACTGTASTAFITYRATAPINLQFNGSPGIGTSAAGVMPASFTPPSDSPSGNMMFFALTT